MVTISFTPTLLCLMTACFSAIFCSFFLGESGQHCFAGRYAHGCGTRHSGQFNLLMFLCIPVFFVLACVLVHFFWKGSFGLFDWVAPVAAGWAIFSEFRFFSLKTAFPALGDLKSEERQKRIRQRHAYVQACGWFIISVISACWYLWLVIADTLPGRIGIVVFALIAIVVFFKKKWRRFQKNDVKKKRSGTGAFFCFEIIFYKLFIALFAKV